jgi:hypothetical protein
LYRELHRLAVGNMCFERGNRTLQPPALVNNGSCVASLGTIALNPI